MSEQNFIENPLAWVAERGLGELANQMGISFSEISAERAVASMPVAGNRQPIGLLHGGAYVVLGETMGSMCANLFAGPNAFAVGVDINATHTHSATSGFVTGICTAIHLGRTLTVHEIAIEDESGKRCSTVRISNFIRQR